MGVRLSTWVRRHLFICYALYGVASACLYTMAAFFPMRAPWSIPPTALDLAIPLVPSAVPVYLTYFWFVPVALWMHRRHPSVAGVFYTTLLCTGAHLLFVNLVPTEIALHDWGREQHALTRFLMAHDTRGAAFPSGHVALPFALAMAMKPQWMGGRRVFLVWGSVVALSTLLTKQHYVQDVVAGLAWGVIAGVVGQRWTRPHVSG